MTTINATDKQLELGFNAVPRLNLARRENRIRRASWWFAQMRQTVASAIDWNAVGEPRPEQIWIPGATRQVKV
ncbi:MAG TPA: hypothetical protein VFV23_14880 [Verrucomicrobiae bacterium]|nr:hypothetical protein [Verrucomicrobiae bacterium]